MKIDYKKDYKLLYLPKAKPEIIDVPEMKFFLIEGEGSPDNKLFRDCVEAIYGLSYAVKMSYKSDDVPAGYYEYTVFPLEGVWDLIDITKPVLDKDNFKYTLMIRQPDFVDQALFEKFLELAKAKKKSPKLADVQFVTAKEGLCMQMMHIGPFADEPTSFAEMEKFCEENGYQRLYKTHREIYLSDPRKVSSDKLKTVLRFQISKN